MYCPRCRNRFTERIAFCPDCGQPLLPETGVQAPAPNGNYRQQAPYPQGCLAQPAPPSRQKKAWLLPLIIGLAALLLLGGAALWYFMPWGWGKSTGNQSFQPGASHPAPVDEERVYEYRLADLTWNKNDAGTDIYAYLLERIEFTDEELRQMEGQSELNLTRYGLGYLDLSEFHYDPTTDFMPIGDAGGMYFIRSGYTGLWLLSYPSDVPVWYQADNPTILTVPDSAEIYDEMNAVVNGDRAAYRMGSVGELLSQPNIYPGIILDITYRGDVITKLEAKYTP